MAATLTRLIFFASGDLHVIINADDDSELIAHRGPLGSTFVDVPKQSYRNSLALRDQMALALPLVAAKDAAIAAAISAKIQAIDTRLASIATAAQPDILS